MSTIRRHLDGIDENLKDARRRAVELYGHMDAPAERNEWLLMLLRDLAIVEEHLESAMLAADAEPSAAVSDAEDPVALARSMQQRRHGGPS